MTDVLTEGAADAFVASWLAAWNAHDADEIAAHYADDVEYHSPFVAQLADGPGYLDGLAAVRSYIAAALERYPDLHFDPPTLVGVGAHSLSMVYRSVNDLTAVETLVLGPDGKVSLALCHYRAAVG
jgi:hypothetical protein